MKNLIIVILMCTTLQVMAQKKHNFSGKYRLDSGKTLRIVRDVEQNDGLKYSIVGYYNKEKVK